MVGARFLLSLKNSVAKICEFLICNSTDLSVSKRVSKDDVLSLYAQTSFVQVVYFMIHCAAVKHPY